MHWADTLEQGEQHGLQVFNSHSYHVSVISFVPVKWRVISATALHAILSHIAISLALLVAQCKHRGHGEMLPILYKGDKVQPPAPLRFRRGHERDYFEFVTDEKLVKPTRCHIY